MQLLVVGTHALFAFEAAAGVRLQSELLATGDARKRMALLSSAARQQGVLGQLRSVDRSFQLRGPRDFRAFNADGFVVDLIRPEDRVLQPQARATVGAATEDLHGGLIFGLQWLLNAHRFASVTIGEDGCPLRVATVEPPAFAVLKRWIVDTAGVDGRLRKGRRGIRTAVIRSHTG